MTTKSVWDDTDRWSGAIYAPDVPLNERRAFRPDGLAPYKLRQRRFRNRWDGRAVLLADLDDWGALRIQKVRSACVDAWRAAKSLSGVVDLIELEHRLSEELWTCTQLEQEIWKLVRQGVREGFETSAARKVIENQITGRQQQLEQLRDEYKALYAEGGADPTTVHDTVREALTRAQALDDSRPIQDAVVWTQALRGLVTEHRQRIEQTPES